MQFENVLFDERVRASRVRFAWSRFMWSSEEKLDTQLERRGLSTKTPLTRHGQSLWPVRAALYAVIFFLPGV